VDLPHSAFGFDVEYSVKVICSFFSGQSKKVDLPPSVLPMCGFPLSPSPFDSEFAPFLS